MWLSPVNLISSNFDQIFSGDADAWPYGGAVDAARSLGANVVEATVADVVVDPVRNEICISLIHLRIEFVRKNMVNRSNSESVPCEVKVRNWDTNNKRSLSGYSTKIQDTKVITTPAYMYNGQYHEIQDGVK